MLREALQTSNAPRPSGTYSQAIQTPPGARLVFLAGQTPRLPDSTLLGDAPFDVQVRQTLDNLEALARSSGLTLADAVRVTVYLRDLTDKAAFDRIYAAYVRQPWPARTIVQSGLKDFALEVDAILAA